MQAFRRKFSVSGKDQKDVVYLGEAAKTALVIIKVDNVALDNAEGVIPRIKNAQQLIPILRFLQQQNPAFKVALVSSRQSKVNTDRSAVGMDLIELVNEFRRYGIAIGDKYVLTLPDVRARQNELYQPQTELQSKIKASKSKIEQYQKSQAKLQEELIADQGATIKKSQNQKKYKVMIEVQREIKAEEANLKKLQDEYENAGLIESREKNVFYAEIFHRFMVDQPDLFKSIEELKQQTVIIDDSLRALGAVENYGVARTIKAPGLDEEGVEYLTNSFANAVGYSSLAEKEKDKYTIREHVELLELYQRLVLEKTLEKEKVTCLIEEIDKIDPNHRSNALIALRTNILASAVYIDAGGKDEISDVETDNNELHSHWKLEETLATILTFVHVYLEAIYDPTQSISNDEMNRLLPVLSAIFNLEKASVEDSLVKLQDVVSKMIGKLEKLEADSNVNTTTSAVFPVSSGQLPEFFTKRASKEATGRSVVLAELLRHLFEKAITDNHGSSYIDNIMVDLIEPRVAKTKLYTTYHQELEASAKGKGGTTARQIARTETQQKALQQYKGFLQLLHNHIETKPSSKNEQAIAQLESLIKKISTLKLKDIRNCKSINEFFEGKHSQFSHDDLQELEAICEQIVNDKVATRARARSATIAAPPSAINISQDIQGTNENEETVEAKKPPPPSYPRPQPPSVSKSETRQRSLTVGATPSASSLADSLPFISGASESTSILEQEGDSADLTVAESSDSSEHDPLGQSLDGSSQNSIC